MRDKRAILTGIATFGIILAISLIVNGALGISGFEGVYEDSLVSRYNIDGKYIKTRVESSLNLGKKLYLLESNIKPLFSETIENSTGIDNIYITDVNNKILYSTRNISSQNYIPFNYYEGEAEPKEESSPYTFKFLDTNFICIPLFTGGTEFTGSVYIEYAQRSITAFILPYIKTAFKVALITFFIALILFAIGNTIFGEHYKYENLSTIAFLLISQLVFSLYSYQSYNKALSSVFNTNMQRLGNSVVVAIEEPLKIAESFSNIANVNKYLAERISGNEQCSSIYIIDTENNVNYEAHNQENTTSTVGSILDLTNSDITALPIGQTLEQEAQYKLALKINRSLINSILRDMALDSGTIIIVALIFSFILKSFIVFLRYKSDILIAPDAMSKTQEKTALRLIEISTFVFMFAAYETLSFIPLYIKESIRTSNVLIPNMPMETLESLPLSTYMVGIMIAMFITLFAMKNISVKNRYTVMSLIFIAGSLITVFSPNIIVFSFSRFVSGFGFGGVLLSTSSLIMKYTNARNRSAGFGTNAAAFASASITSIPVGGVIVNKFGYEAGIIVSVIFAFAFLIFAVCYIPEEKRVSTTEKSSSNISIKDFFTVFFSRHVLTYILCVNIPFQIIYWGLFQFLLPIYMSETLNLSQGNIGRILGIFSVVSLFAASVSQLADKARNDKLLIGVGAIFAGAVMFIFGYFEGGIVLFFGIMLAMGVDNLFIDSIEEVYLESGHVKNVSEENLLQTYKVIEKVLSVFIPSVTTIIIIQSGFNKSMQIIGAYSAIGALLFILLGKNGRWEKKNED